MIIPELARKKVLPELVPIQDPSPIFLLGLQLQADHVTPAFRFAHSECTYFTTSDEVREVLLLLGRSAMSVDLIQAQVGVGTIGESYRPRRPGDL